MLARDKMTTTRDGAGDIVCERRFHVAEDMLTPALPAYLVVLVVIMAID